MSEMRLYVLGVAPEIAAMLLILGVGLYLTVRLGAPQLVLLPRALRLFLRRLISPEKKDGVSSFQALCTALAATVGTGNLVGVAGAICLGGPGAIFWMWVCGFLGMATKYSETALALRYRVKTPAGFSGGPMYVMTRGLGERFRPMARLYCLFGIFAAFGVGNAAQINAVVTGCNGILTRLGGRPGTLGNLLLGAGMAMAVGVLLRGGAKRVGKTAQFLVPFAAAGYILMCAVVLLVFRGRILSAFQAIFAGAFCPRAVTGGALGSAMTALRVGCSRGVFTNEAGMGTASIAHASAQNVVPAEQGLMGIVEVFLDTILICTLTALVILVTGVPIPYGQDVGGTLTEAAFARVYGSWAGVLITAALILFATATVLGWGYYGTRFAAFLWGNRGVGCFVTAQSLAVVLGAVLDTRAVWRLSEVFNGLMAIPNLICLAVLGGKLSRITKEYKNPAVLAAAGGGKYADFHKREPL